jgi:hypothetical protein
MRPALPEIKLPPGVGARRFPARLREDLIVRMQDSGLQGSNSKLKQFDFELSFRLSASFHVISEA